MRGMASAYQPLRPSPGNFKGTENPDRMTTRTRSMGQYEQEEDVAMDPHAPKSTQKKFRYRLWAILHRLQGFETRFALKVAIVTSLLSVPAWLPQNRDWWNEYESWWAVVRTNPLTYFLTPVW
jgi:hypothetical protein